MAWYSNQWSYRKQIVIQSTQVLAPLIDFTVEVSLIDAGMIGKVQAGGGDILFTTDDELTKIPHEIELYNDTSGTILAWVGIANLSDTVDATIYMYYGNPSAANQEDVANTWDSSVVSIWHLDESPDDLLPEFKDKISGFHGSASGSLVADAQQTGQIHNAIDFSGANDYIAIPHQDELAQTLTMTISAWVNHEVTDTNDAILSKYQHVTDTSWAVQSSGTNAMRMFLADSLTSSGSDYATTANNVLTTGSWNHVVWIYNGAGSGDADKIKCYVDGVDQSLTMTGTIPASLPAATAELQIGRLNTLNRYWNGLIDEVRYESTNRSGDWVTTTFNNQSNPSAFMTIGLEELIPWYDLGWILRKPLTINGPLVMGNLTDFTILVAITDADLLADAQASGNDILFTDDDDITKLSHEIQSYDNTTGALIAWVKIPQLVQSNDKIINMYYGNPTAIAQEDRNGTWNDDFAGVWHFEGLVTDPILDSSRVGFTMASRNMSDGDHEVPSQIGQGYWFKGSDDYLVLFDRPALDVTDNVTFSCWFRMNFDEADHTIISKANHGTSSTFALTTKASSSLRIFIYDSPTGSGNDYASTPDNTVLPNLWHRVAFVYNGSGSANADRLKFYRNDSEETLTFNGTIPSSLIVSTADLEFGRFGSVIERHLQGYIDEPRLSVIPRSLEWLQTEYHTEATPNLFLTVGSPEDSPIVGIIPGEGRAVGTSSVIAIGARLGLFTRRGMLLPCYRRRRRVNA